VIDVASGRIDTQQSFTASETFEKIGEDSSVVTGVRLVPNRKR
jgi:hypothetical protein